MMGFRVWCEVVCSRCADVNGGRYTNTGIPRKSIKEDVELDGWVFYEHGGVHCESCAKQKKRAEYTPGDTDQ